MKLFFACILLLLSEKTWYGWTVATTMMVPPISNDTAPEVYEIEMDTKLAHMEQGLIEHKLHQCEAKVAMLEHKLRESERSKQLLSRQLLKLIHMKVVRHEELKLQEKKAHLTTVDYAMKIVGVILGVILLAYFLFLLGKMIYKCWLKTRRQRRQREARAAAVARAAAREAVEQEEQDGGAEGNESGNEGQEIHQQHVQFNVL